MFPGHWEVFCRSYYFFILYLYFCISENFFITMWDIFTLGEKEQGIMKFLLLYVFKKVSCRN